MTSKAKKTSGILFFGSTCSSSSRHDFFGVGTADGTEIVPFESSSFPCSVRVVCSSVADMQYEGNKGETS